MTATISRRLNLVLPPFETKEGTAYVHSIPVGRSVFEGCFRSMSRALSMIIGESNPLIGVSVAKLYLQSAAEWVSDAEVKKVSGTLIPEIRRLTNVGVVGKNNVLPYVVACQQGLLDEDQQAEVENFIVYFTLVSWLKMPEDIQGNIGVTALLETWKAQTTSLELMEFMRGLPTSTPGENTGATIPSPKTKAVPQSSLAA